MEAALLLLPKIMYSQSLMSSMAALGLFGACLAMDVPPLPKPTTAVDTCASQGCHADTLNHKFMHGPVAQQK